MKTIIRTTTIKDFNEILADPKKSLHALTKLTEYIKMLWESPIPFMEQLIQVNLQEKLTDQTEIQARDTLLRIVMAAIEVQPN